jgi:hypothetical protein
MEGDHLDVDFGIGRNEAETMMKNLIESGKIGPDDITWDNSASLATTGERFYAKTPAPDPENPGKTTMVEMNGQVFAYDGGSISSQGITLAQFKAMFQANQMHATKSKVASRLKVHPEYCDLSKGRTAADRFAELIEKIYLPVFPHTAILGAKVDSKTNWPNFITLLIDHKPPNKDTLVQAILSFYEAKSFFSDEPLTKRKERAEKLANLLLAGAGGVKDYLFKLFATHQLEPIADG